MRQTFRFLLPILAIVLLVPAAQAQDSPYDEGHIYGITFIRTGPNTTDEYLEQLSTVWVAMMEKAEQKGLIVDYMILAGQAANQEDFDLMLVTVFENWAAFDTLDDKMAALEAEMFSDEEMQKKIASFQSTGRVILGSKTMQELKLKVMGKK